MGVGRDTSNVFSAPVLLVLTSSGCVCCRLGEMARGQAGVLLVWPSGSVQFKVALDTVRGFLCLFSKQFDCVAALRLERRRGGDERRG